MAIVVIGAAAGVLLAAWGLWGMLQSLTVYGRNIVAPPRFWQVVLLPLLAATVLLLTRHWFFSLLLLPTVMIDLFLLATSSADVDRRSHYLGATIVSTIDWLGRLGLVLGLAAYVTVRLTGASSIWVWQFLLALAVGSVAALILNVVLWFAVDRVLAKLAAKAGYPG